MTANELHLLRCLAWMCDQYLTTPEDAGLDHMCMSAGEQAVDALAAYGLVTINHRGGEWTEAGHALLKSRR
ncbi:hypothetical protein [Brevundimonas sp.]|uniref:hypothetical protein n=1 Tax=Brevundimonas sp. TaxID=1871086 RepID=UPI003AF8C79F